MAAATDSPATRFTINAERSSAKLAAGFPKSKSHVGAAFAAGAWGLAVVVVVGAGVGGGVGRAPEQPTTIRTNVTRPTRTNA